jgi:TRAP-type transport system periplasmic protein
MKQAFIRLVAGGMALAAMLTAGAAQEQPIALSLSHGFPSSHPLHAAVNEWAAAVAKESKGTVAVRVYPDQQLGKTFDHYDMARTGAADVVISYPGLQIGRFPLFAAGELPLLFANAIGGTAAFDAWHRAYAVQEMPDVKYCLAFIHDPGTLHVVRRKIEIPIDMRGVKVRATQNTLTAYVKLLGGSNVRAPESELRDLLVREMAQAVALPWQTAILSGTDQIARNHLDLPLYTTPFALVLNKDKYAAMTEAQRGVIDRHCTNSWAVKIARPWADWERAGRDAMRSLKGHELYAITSDQIAAWRTAAEPLTATWVERVKRVGGDPDAALKALKAALAKYDAAF